MFVASIGIVALVGSGAKAQMYQYVLDGGTATLTGSIGSTTFTNAKWSVTRDTRVIYSVYNWS